ncbi:hypothetical protein VCRA2110O135_200041 [Vibrio crassostreae]|nr:hypothetical protein VCRA2110O135_200041 [Vibrio crassostreae]
MVALIHSCTVKVRPSVHSQTSSQLKTKLGYAVQGITDAKSASSYTGTVTVSTNHVRHR